MLRGDDLASAGGNVVTAGHPEYAAEMVGMAVGIDDGNHPTFTQSGVSKIKTGACTWCGGQRVNNYPTGFTGDEGDVGDVISAGLPDAGGYFK